ncbi:MAG: S1C family serine protease [Actinomycetota bacterium]|nr:S1C family serine protease [Actinomycetota bacterium]
MPTPPDPDDDEVVVLVDGRGAASTLRPSRGRADREGPATSLSGSTADRRDAPVGWPSAAPTGVGGGLGGGPVGGTAPSVPSGPPAPVTHEAGPRAPKHPKPPRSRSGGSFLRSHLRVPGTLGLVVIVLALALGTGFVGAYIWASNDARNVRTSPVAAPIPRRADSARDAQVTTTTKPDLSADSLVEKLGPSVWTVRTFDSAGQPVVGSALLAQSAGGQGLLLTSLAVVEASTHQPVPEITVSGGGFNGKAQLWTWDDAHDLALLVVDGTSTPGIDWVSDATGIKAGDKVFALGGDKKVKPGLITTVSDQALEHNVFIDDGLRGGPIVNLKGEVVAVSSAAYTAGGVATETSFFGIPIRASCAAVLTCTGAFAGPGTPVPSVPSSPDTTTTTQPD